MHVPYDQLPMSARTWAYQADRPLEADEQQSMRAYTTAFLDNWSSHGQPLHGGATILADRFLIIGVDESHKAVSGCAYDASARFVQELERVLGICLLDRSQIAFQNKQGHIYTIPITQVEESIADNRVSADDSIFDISLATKGDIQHKFPMPLTDSWAGRYVSVG